MIKIEEIKEICKRYNMNQEQVKEQIKTYEILNKMGGVYISCNAWGYYYTIDKRNYTENRNPNVFDIVELDIGIIYGSNIEEKMQFVKDEQKEIIIYCYYKIFERYANTYGDILFPIRYIKPTVYQASGIKATDTVNLCIIFELKTAKKNNQGE